MPNNSSKPALRRVKKIIKVTPQIRTAYEKRNRALDADPDARSLPPEAWEKSLTRKDFFKNIETRAKAKKQTTVRLDADVLDWLKSKGTGHISRVNRILRAVMLAELKR